jgi:hypothetical protein
MRQFQEEVKLFLAEQVLGAEFRVSHDSLDLISIAHIKVPHKVLLVLHRLGACEAEHLKKINTFHSTPDLKVIHFWEDLWNFHREKVQSRLISILGKSLRIHGRACAVETINNDELVTFLADNHLNVPIKAKYKYGLFHENLLVAVMSFSRGRIMDRGGETYNSFELLRFGSKLNHTVVGGFTKLLAHFIGRLEPDDIMTYVDKDWSDGRACQKAGFTMVGEIQPMEFFVNAETGQRQYAGKRDEGISQISAQLGENDFVKVFNSGSYKYVRLLK